MNLLFVEVSGISSQGCDDAYASCSALLQSHVGVLLAPAAWRNVVVLSILTCHSSVLCSVHRNACGFFSDL